MEGDTMWTRVSNEKVRGGRNSICTLRLGHAALNIDRASSQEFFGCCGQTFTLYHIPRLPVKFDLLSLTFPIGSKLQCQSCLVVGALKYSWLRRLAGSKTRRTSPTLLLRPTVQQRTTTKLATALIVNHAQCKVWRPCGTHLSIRATNYTHRLLAASLGMVIGKLLLGDE